MFCGIWISGKDLGSKLQGRIIFSFQYTVKFRYYDHLKLRHFIH